MVVEKQQTPQSSAPPQPPRPRTMVEAQQAAGIVPVTIEGTRQDVFSLAEGTVTIQWPASLSQDSYEDLGAWLDILKRKIGRSVVKELKVSVADSLAVKDEVKS